MRPRRATTLSPVKSDNQLAVARPQNGLGSAAWDACDEARGDKLTQTSIGSPWRDESDKYRGMSAGTIEDAEDALPLHGADHPMGATLDVAADGKPRHKARTKRPRPTFDDGSVTRVFKFPSKAYPRSSYYVTGTEIVIRIKKARKKWKLVIPKKRVTAYRTNRWFAKPRWVEIELTYTQALKHSLVEPRTPSAEVTGGKTAEQSVASDPSVEDAAVVPRWLPHDGTRMPLLQTLPMAGADVCSTQAKSAGAAPRASAFLLIALSALGLASAAWITLSDSSTTPMTVELACTRSASSCTQTIVTGAIGKADQPQSPDHRASADFVAPASSEPISATEQLQLSAPQLPEIATIPTEREDDSAKVGNRADSGSERTGTVNAATESDPLPAETTPKTSLLLPQDVPADRYDCRELHAASQSIIIPFDYANSSLNQASLPALAAFAAKLRSCPSTKVIIEGHTDSDGSAAWNQSLSVHRAKAVLEHLVRVGVQPSQLSVIGFGQSRPYAPNVSTKNKRSNRRAVLVVDIHR
jgi:outer membrane protein OmpA-like peptidoglycan-associated protein